VQGEATATRSTNVVSKGKYIRELAYLRLSIVVLLALGEWRADRTVQQPGYRAWTGRSQRYRRVGVVFVFCSGALLALLERAEPRSQLRVVREQATGVYETQAAALQLGTFFADLRCSAVGTAYVLQGE
jgi:hypothetical protein